MLLVWTTRSIIEDQQDSAEILVRRTLFTQISPCIFALDTFLKKHESSIVFEFDMLDALQIVIKLKREG